jgi:hypothetical protein
MLRRTQSLRPFLTALSGSDSRNCNASTDRYLGVADALFIIGTEIISCMGCSFSGIRRSTYFAKAWIAASLLFLVEMLLWRISVSQLRYFITLSALKCAMLIFSGFMPMDISKKLIMAAKVSRYDRIVFELSPETPGRYAER